MVHPQPPAKNKTDLQPSSPPDGATRAPKVSKGSGRSARRRARELALQGLYQWLIAGRDAATIQTQPLDDGEALAGADAAHYRELLNGATITPRICALSSLRIWIARSIHCLPSSTRFS